MKTIPTGSKEILDKALELETRNELHLVCDAKRGRNVLREDLERCRLWLIKEKSMTKYEQIIIDETTLNGHYNVILRKLNILSTYIKKPGGGKEEIKL